jgi:hypothetical protein
MLLAESVWASVGFEVLGAIMPILAGVITLALTALVKKGVDKLGISRSQEIDTMIDKYVGIGINYAQKAASNKLDGRSHDGKSKMTIAVKTVLDELNQSGITGVAEDLIVARIENALHDKEIFEPKKLG